MSERNEMGCEEFAGVAAELALGVLTGRERAQALAHLDRCETCRADVRQLTMTGEELLGLLPSSEPPPGFEIRVMERIGLPVPSPGSGGRKRVRIGWALRANRTRRMLAVAVAALAVAGAGLGGWGLRAATAPAAAPAASTRLASAPLFSADGQTAGWIFVYNGHPGWLYMSVDLASGNGPVICQLTGTDGRVITVGSFPLSNGYGAWGSPDPTDVGPITGARLVSMNGMVLATARFTMR